MNNTFTLTIDSTTWELPKEHHCRAVQALDTAHAEGQALFQWAAEGQLHTIYIDHPTVMYIGS